MTTYCSGTVTGPGGSLAWRLTGPALLVEAARARTELQAAYTAVARATGARLKAQAAAAYPYRSISQAFGYRTQSSPYAAVTVFNSSPIFPYVEYNTRPHVIRAKAGPYLHFKIGDRWVRTASVNHPGTKGRYIMARLFQEAQRGFQAALQAATREVLTRG